MLEIFRSMALEICKTMDAAAVSPKAITPEVVRLSDLNEDNKHSVIHEIARIETLLSRITESDSSLKSA